jgi:hypothetical protein
LLLLLNENKNEDKFGQNNHTSDIFVERTFSACRAMLTSVCTLSLRKKPQRLLAQQDAVHSIVHMFVADNARF